MGDSLIKSFFPNVVIETSTRLASSREDFLSTSLAFSNRLITEETELWCVWVFEAISFTVENRRTSIAAKSATGLHSIPLKALPLLMFRESLEGSYG